MVILSTAGESFSISMRRFGLQLAPAILGFRPCPNVSGEQKRCIYFKLDRSLAFERISLHPFNRGFYAVFMPLSSIRRILPLYGILLNLHARLSKQSSQSRFL